MQIQQRKFTDLVTVPSTFTLHFLYHLSIHHEKKTCTVVRDETENPSRKENEVLMKENMSCYSHYIQRATSVSKQSLQMKQNIHKTGNTGHYFKNAMQFSCSEVLLVLANIYQFIVKCQDLVDYFYSASLGVETSRPT